MRPSFDADVRHHFHLAERHRGHGHRWLSGVTPSRSRPPGGVDRQGRPEIPPPRRRAHQIVAPRTNRRRGSELAVIAGEGDAACRRPRPGRSGHDPRRRNRPGSAHEAPRRSPRAGGRAPPRKADSSGGGAAVVAAVAAVAARAPRDHSALVRASRRARHRLLKAVGDESLPPSRCCGPPTGRHGSRPGLRTLLSISVQEDETSTSVPSCVIGASACPGVRAPPRPEAPAPTD